MDISLISNSDACVRSFLFASGYCAVDALGDCLMMDGVPKRWSVLCGQATTVTVVVSWLRLKCSLFVGAGCCTKEAVALYAVCIDLVVLGACNFGSPYEHSLAKCVY
jgi:hypothetical protein